MKQSLWLALLLVVCLLAPLAVAQGDAPFYGNLEWHDNPYRGQLIVPPDFIGDERVETWVRYAVAVDRLMSDGEKWATCTRMLGPGSGTFFLEVPYLAERYGHDNLTMFRLLFCR